MTAHTRDDQAETLIMRAAVGSGVAGLRGIPQRNGLRRRPFLAVGRTSMEAYAAQHGIAYCTDPTNTDERYRRNAVRRRVTPEMAAIFGDGWTRCAARTADNLALAEAALGELLEPTLRRIVRYAPDCIAVERAELIAMAEATRRMFWVYLTTRECRGRYTDFFRVSELQLSALDDLAVSGRQGQSRDLGRGWFASVEGTALCLRSSRTRPTTVSPRPVQIDGPGRYLRSLVYRRK